jgi:hypothetical protein
MISEFGGPLRPIIFIFIFIFISPMMSYKGVWRTMKRRGLKVAWPESVVGVCKTTNKAPGPLYCPKLRTKIKSKDENSAPEQKRGDQTGFA